MCVLSKRNQSANNTRLKRSTRQVSKEFHNIGVGSADDRDEGSNNRRETSENNDENLIRSKRPPFIRFDALSLSLLVLPSPEEHRSKT